MDQKFSTKAARNIKKNKNTMPRAKSQEINKKKIAQSSKMDDWIDLLFNYS